MDPSELVTVYTVAKDFEAEIIKNYLDSEGIRCFIGGEHQAGDAGLMGLEIKIQVAAVDAGRARKLIKEHKAQRLDEEAEET